MFAGDNTTRRHWMCLPEHDNGSLSCGRHNRTLHLEKTGAGAKPVRCSLLQPWVFLFFSFFLLFCPLFILFSFAGSLWSFANDANWLVLRASCGRKTQIFTHIDMLYVSGSFPFGETEMVVRFFFFVLFAYYPALLQCFIWEFAVCRSWICYVKAAGRKIFVLRFL